MRDQIEIAGVQVRHPSMALVDALQRIWAGAQTIGTAREIAEKALAQMAVHPREGCGGPGRCAHCEAGEGGPQP